MRNLRTNTVHRRPLPILIQLHIRRRDRPLFITIIQQMTKMEDMSTRKADQRLNLMFRERLIASYTMTWFRSYGMSL